MRQRNASYGLPAHKKGFSGEFKGSDVEDVVVNGKPIVREGRSLTLNVNQILILAKAKE